MKTKTFEILNEIIEEIINEDKKTKSKVLSNQKRVWRKDVSEVQPILSSN